MKTLLPASLLIACASHAAVITFDGFSNNTDTSHNYTWVLGSQMYESLDTGGGTGNGTTNTFASIADPTQFAFTFGDLELAPPPTSLEPGAASAGYELYREIDLITQDIIFTYNSVEWVRAELVGDLRIDVSDINDANAIGTSVIHLISNTPAGQAFYDEVGTLSGSTYLLQMDNANFFPVSAGNFTSDTTMTVIPEPATFALIFGAAGLALAVIRRRK